MQTPLWKFYDKAVGQLPTYFWLAWVLFLSFGESWLHISARDNTIVSDALVVAIGIQLFRGFLGFLRIPQLPKWLPIRALNDRRIYIEIVIVMSITWVLGHFALPPQIDIKRLSGPILVIYLCLCVSVGALWIRQQVLSGEAAALKFLVTYMAPFAAAATIAVTMYWILGLQKDHAAIKILSISALTPMIAAMIQLFCRDQRDRGKNTKTVINTQFAALPLIPISFFIIKAIWPKNIDANLLIIPLILVPIILSLLNLRRKTPWLIKEKLQILRWQLHRSKTGNHPDSELPADFDQRLAQARQELADLELNSKDARDFVDKGDSYRELGHLEYDMKDFMAAEKNYVNAIEAYDDALALAPDNDAAKSQKAETLQNLSHVRWQLNDKDRKAP